MKTFYKWLTLAVIIFLIILPILTYVPLIYLTGNTIITADFFDNIANPIFTVLFAGNYVVGALYFIAGIVWVIMSLVKKNTKKRVSGIKISVMGIVVVIIPFLITAFCVLIGYCGLSLPDFSTANIPVDFGNHYHGFPVQNLKILKIQAIQPNTPGDTWGCAITVQNTSSSTTANNISFGLAYSTYASDSDDTIRPGQTRVIRIASYSTGIKNPCDTKASVQSAGIVK